MFVISEWGKPLLKKDLKPRRLKENIDRFDYMKTLKQIKKQQLWGEWGRGIEEDRYLQHIKYKVTPINQNLLQINQQKTNYPININKWNGKVHKRAMKRQFMDLQIAN